MQPQRAPSYQRLGAPAVCLATAFALFACSTATAQQAPQTQRQYLSGKDRDSAVPWDFFCTSGRRSGEWTTIPVPSCWDMVGFGTLSFYKDKDVTPAEQGLYRQTFVVP